MASQHREHQREAVAVDAGRRAARRDDLGRRDQRLHLDQQRPGSLHRAEDHRAGRRAGLAHEARRGVGDLDQAALPHLEDADLAGRAEAVLERAERAEGPLPLALEVKHAVDQVLEGAGPGQRALLGHVADQDQRHVEPLRRLEQRRRSPRGLRRRCPGAESGIASVWTESITQAAGRSASSGGEDGLERGLGEHRHGERRLAEPLGAAADLRRRLLAGDVEDLVAGRAAMLASAMPASVLLPIPGAPPSRTSEPGTRPPPSTRSSSAIPVPSRAERSACTSRSGPASAPRGRFAAPRRAERAVGALTCSSVFQAPQPGHCPVQVSAAWPHSEHLKGLPSRPCVQARDGPDASDALPERA